MWVWIAAAHHRTFVLKNLHMVDVIATAKILKFLLPEFYYFSNVRFFHNR